MKKLFICFSNRSETGAVVISNCSMPMNSAHREQIVNSFLSESVVVKLIEMGVFSIPDENCIDNDLSIW